MKTALQVLTELVALKKLKTEMDDLAFVGKAKRFSDTSVNKMAALRADYLRRHPEAWKAALEVVEAPATSDERIQLFYNSTIEAQDLCRLYGDAITDLRNKISSLDRYSLDKKAPGLFKNPRGQYVRHEDLAGVLRRSESNLKDVL